MSRIDKQVTGIFLVQDDGQGITSPFEDENGWWHQQIIVIPPVATQGIRTVSYQELTITSTLAVMEDDSDYPGMLFWCLKYSPGGGLPPYMQTVPPVNSSWDMSPGTHTIIASGALNRGGQRSVVKINQPLTLHSGDSVFFEYMSTKKNDNVIFGQLAYGVRYN